MQALKIAFINILEDNQNGTKDIDMWVVCKTTDCLQRRSDELSTKESRVQENEWLLNRTCTVQA